MHVGGFYTPLGLVGGNYNNGSNAGAFNWNMNNSSSNSNLNLACRVLICEYIRFCVYKSSSAYYFP